MAAAHWDSLHVGVCSGTKLIPGDCHYLVVGLGVFFEFARGCELYFDFAKAVFQWEPIIALK